MDVIGQVLQIFEPQQITERFRKREIVLELDGNSDYPQTVLFELINDKCDLADFVSVGDTVRVNFGLRGRAWTNPDGVTKYFNSLNAYKLVSETGSRAAPPPAKPDYAPPPSPPPVEREPGSDDDLDDDLDDDIPF